MTNVYPDGEALSEWELQILEEMELDFDLRGVRVIPFLFQGAPAGLWALTPYFLVTETAVALAVLTVSMTGALAGLAELAAIGTSLWWR